MEWNGYIHYDYHYYVVLCFGFFLFFFFFLLSFFFFFSCWSTFNLYVIEMNVLSWRCSVQCEMYERGKEVVRQ